MSNQVNEYVKFKTMQFIRLNGVNTKGMSKDQLAEIVRPHLKSWVAEAMASGRV